MPNEKTDGDFEALLARALDFEMSGWDFSHLLGRYQESTPSWSFRESVLRCLSTARSILDIDTGGGEFLRSLAADLPAVVHATEGFEPNVNVSRKRLDEIGVVVAEVPSGAPLPYEDATFDLIVNRHGSVVPHEVARCLAPGGRYITQQVGSLNNKRLDELLAHGGPSLPNWDLAHASAEIENAGLRIFDAREEYASASFSDVGAVVLYLRAIPWQIPGFSVEEHVEELRCVHDMIERDGELTTTTHRFFIEVGAE